MGGGSWTTTAFSTYSTSKGLRYDAVNCAIVGDYSNQELFKSRTLDEKLNPYKVLRECRDSDEHPHTIPIILALDVTGSMGQSAVEVAKKLNKIMTDTYDNKGDKDVEFMIMGIGDVECDGSPIQISQFESDIRIAEQLDKVYFEFGGGGNSYESYTAAWYMGCKHTDLDCWKRGQKGIIITMGDERLNPVLTKRGLSSATGDNLQADVETTDLYIEASKLFDIYHIQVNHRSYSDSGIEPSWKSVLGENYKEANLDNITDVITEIISSALNNGGTTTVTSDGIVW